MSLTLTNYPVETVGSQIQNVLPGCDRIKVDMQRVDLYALANVNYQYYNASDYLGIIITETLYNYLNVGDYIFIYDPYFYNQPVRVSAKEYDTTHRIITDALVYGDSLLGSLASGAYMNYKRDYYVECRILKTLIAPGVIGSFEREINRVIDQGSASGNIVLDLSLVNDLNEDSIELTSGLKYSRSKKIYIEYREIYDDDLDPDWVSVVEDDIIVAYAIVKPDIDKVLSDMSNPKIYLGYPNVVGLWHSDDNNPGNHIEIVINYQTINKVTSSAIAGEVFNYYDFGLMMQMISSVPAGTEYVKFDVNTEV